MSWFTASPTTGRPTCERCKTHASVVLVKRGKDFDIFDCRKCGPVVNKRSDK